MPQIRLKLLQKVQVKKQQKQLVIWIVTKYLIKLQKSQKRNNGISQKQLQMNMIKKYRKNVSRGKTQNYWWSKINIMVQYNNGISKNNKFVR